MSNSFFLSSSFRFDMADTSNRNEAAIHDVSWVGNELLEAVLSFASNGATKILYSSIGRREDWRVNLPRTSGRVCLQYTRNRFPMYEVIFKDVGFRLPFSSFQISVL
jgi:hypothetical protein